MPARPLIQERSGRPGEGPGCPRALLAPKPLNLGPQREPFRGPKSVIFALLLLFFSSTFSMIFGCFSMLVFIDFGSPEVAKSMVCAMKNIDFLFSKRSLISPLFGVLKRPLDPKKDVFLGALSTSFFLVLFRSTVRICCYTQRLRAVLVFSIFMFFYVFSSTFFWRFRDPFGTLFHDFGRIWAPPKSHPNFTSGAPVETKLPSANKHVF